MRRPIRNYGMVLFQLPFENTRSSQTSGALKDLQACSMVLFFQVHLSALEVAVAKAKDDGDGVKSMCSFVYFLSYVLVSFFSRFKHLYFMHVFVFELKLNLL